MSAFENAPITSVMCVGTALLSWFFGSASKEISFDLRKVFHGEIWRLISSQIIFGNMAQTIVGVMLLYTCRQFERQLGIRKYGAFTFVSFSMSLLMQFTFTSVSSLIGISYIPSHGPYFLIFSLMPFYYNQIPKFHSSEYHLMGIGFSEKSWTYLMAAQLLFSDGLRSVGPSLAGMLTGYLYITNKNRIQSFRLPSAVENVIGFTGGFIASLLPFASITQNPRARGGRGGNAGAGAGGNPMNAGARAGLGVDGPGAGFQEWRNAVQGLGQDLDRDLQGYGGVGRNHVGPPSDESIASLTALGFERAAAVRALQATGNDVDAAANMLLR